LDDQIALTLKKSLFLDLDFLNKARPLIKTAEVHLSNDNEHYYEWNHHLAWTPDRPDTYLGQVMAYLKKRCTCKYFGLHVNVKQNVFYTFGEYFEAELIPCVERIMKNNQLIDARFFFPEEVTFTKYNTEESL
jgi:hypothetical protein